MLQLLKNLRSHSQGKEITDADILNWANNKVKRAGRTSQMESFKVIKQKITSSYYIDINMYLCIPFLLLLYLHLSKTIISLRYYLLSC
jgi:hypothetical protein